MPRALSSHELVATARWGPNKRNKIVKWECYSTEDKIRISRVAEGGKRIVGIGNPKNSPASP